MTKQKTRMEKPAPAVAEEVPAVVIAKRDPSLCVCVGITRRYDGDGAPVVLDGVNHYPCAACGKLYA